MKPSSELKKTGIFLIAAALFGGIGWWYAPRGWQSDGGITVQVSDVGERFFHDLDITKASNLLIKSTDESTRTTVELKVERVDDPNSPHKGLWLIRRAGDDYPTDAKERLGQAATLIGFLQKGSRVSEKKSEQEAYGVVDVDDPVELDKRGIGTKVKIGRGSEVLAQLIIGKEDPKATGFHFVRVPGQDAIYRAKISPEKFSTKFEDWIETDLLMLNRFDIQDVVLDNHSVELTPIEQNPFGQVFLRPTRKSGELLKLSFDGDANSWKLFDSKSDAVPAAWQEAVFDIAVSELDRTKLDDLSSALDELKIVDVIHKPEGLAADMKLQADLLPKDDSRESFIAFQRLFQELGSRGFFLNPKEGTISSKQGETRVGMRDGVEYLLRFGDIVGDETSGGKEGKLNRYLMVSARFNEALLTPPSYMIYTPPDVAPLHEPGESAPDRAPKTADVSTAADALAQVTANESAPNDGCQPPADPTKLQPLNPQPDVEDTATIIENMKKKQVDSTNERLKKDFDKNIEDGKKKAQQLNERFAEWYYIISEDVFKKIHLTRAEIVKSKAATPAAGTPGGSLPETLNIPSIPSPFQQTPATPAPSTTEPGKTPDSGKTTEPAKTPEAGQAGESKADESKAESKQGKELPTAPTPPGEARRARETGPALSATGRWNHSPRARTT